MNKLMSVLAISTLLVSPAFAASDHQHGDNKNDNQSMQSGMKMSHGRMMSTMQEHKKSMGRLIGQLKKEQNQSKRDALIEAHMKEMHKSMKMLNHAEGTATSTATEERMKMMEERMGMMQMMMSHMMESMIEVRRSSPKHIKK